MRLKLAAAVLCLMVASSLAVAADAPPAKIGLIVTGTTTDGAWNQLAWDCLKAFAAKNKDVTTAKRENVKDTDAADAIRQFDAKGFNLIIAHGFEYQQAAADVTKNGEVKAKIVVSGGDQNNPNFQSLAYDLSGASYQLGIVAAKVSKTGKLGFIGGTPDPPVTAMARGFEAGAKSVNPKATVVVQYTGWDDPNKAKQQAQAFIAQGVDVIMQNVDAASKGVFEAVAEENANLDHSRLGNVYTFGANSDQNANTICADYMLGSAVIKMDVAFDQVLKEVRDGTFKGGLVKEDLANGVCVAVLNPKLVGKVIDEGTRKLVEQAGKDLISGKVRVPDEKK